MTKPLAINPERMAAVYTMLRTFPPFCRWKLPPAELVKFHVEKTDRRFAFWWIDGGGTHHIAVSKKRHYTMLTLVMSMAHEMLHVKQRVARTETANTEHNAEFKHLAKRLCQTMGFDYGAF